MMQLSKCSARGTTFKGTWCGLHKITTEAKNRSHATVCKPALLQVGKDSPNISDVQAKVTAAMLLLVKVKPRSFGSFDVSAGILAPLCCKSRATPKQAPKKCA
jgi:hypothetical protein